MRRQSRSLAQVQRLAKANPLAEFVVDLNELDGNPTNVAAYVVAWIEASRETDAVLGVGSEDGFVAWRNGRRVASVLEARARRLARLSAACASETGCNERLSKIILTEAGWKFSADLTDVVGRRLGGVRYRRGDSTANLSLNLSLVLAPLATSSSMLVDS